MPLAASLIAANLLTAPLYFPTREAAEKTLVGYNYGLIQLTDGRYQAFVSGLNGSGQQNTIGTQAGDALVQISAGAGGTEATEMPFPKVTLKEKVNGQAAIEALGDQLPAVAEQYGMSAERLQSILRTDTSAWIDQSGHLLYIDSEHEQTVMPDNRITEVNRANAATAAGIDTFSATAATNTDPFTLHSKPGSNRTVYLDFNGYQASNSAWYSGTLTAKPYDTDANPSGFSTAEQNNIREIWQRVAEDYAPFDVDVTTQEPAADALRRTGSSDAVYGVRVAVTQSMPELCSQSCGGVSYINVFSYYSSSNPDYYNPVWVFFDKLGGGYPKYVADAVSHEVGHALNLTHDGTSTTSYYAGQGSGATGWAPIMGVGYYQPLTQWSKGEYPDANNPQDDIAVIAAAGAPQRADDFGNTTATAAPLSGTSSAVLQTGIIERRTDVDLFTFFTDGGSVQFSAASGSSTPNLDISLKLLNSQGSTLVSANPADTLSATLTATLAAGQYFLQVDGTGYGDLSTGYSDYASVGQYQITGSYPKSSATTLAPSAILTALPTSGTVPLTVSFDGSGSVDQDGSIVGYDWNFGDGSANAASANASHVYNAVGTYSATLTVTDNSGLKSSATQTISVAQAPAAAIGIKVGSTKLTRRLLGKNKAQCVATVAVNDGTSGVAGATVYGSWSGSIKTNSGSTTLTGSTSATTVTTGSASIASANLPANSSGTCAFTVSKVVKAGYSYDGSGQVSASFSW
ncbi:PKD domain-containing protein [Methylomonas koyamae]|uniref:PKD domain-containing protein n=1 Tax=Methylomonas koyamae TaxID=702114 RepID=UPI001C321D20|nr:PKD domain-containing protein [Methylomonas koyamae]BBL58573.1 hypothetical protein MKFW12EY_21860 [Methylomonas koyamae]